MKDENPIILKRDCPAVMVPSGEKVGLMGGSSVWMTQALGGSYTVMTDRGYMVRIDGHDSDALGLTSPPEIKAENPGAADNIDAIEQQVWNQLRSCFDPEIPVNIVDLGLIYDCSVTALPAAGFKALVRFTLTAQGCGMGQFLQRDIQNKLLAVPGIMEAQVELVWDPPWNQSKLSAAAKQQLGIE
jgi:probable FeS assembly SUF system protein SufT